MAYTLVRASKRRVLLGGLISLALGLLVYSWLLNTPAGLLGKADALGYAVCHRIDLRSFHLGDRAVPLCARCSGMYLGAVLGLLYQAGSGRRRGGFPPWRVAIVLGGLALAFSLDGVNSYLHFFPGAPVLYEPQNWLRLATGMGLGVGIAAVLYPAFQQTIWADWEARPALGDLRSLASLLILAVFLVGIVLTENPLVLYPLALISAGGVLLVLALIYTLIWVVVLRQENRFQRWPAVGLPLLGGFGLAMLQIALIDLGRYALTGTWRGFHLG
jgi:uncharacterized membrane protein